MQNATDCLTYLSKKYKPKRANGQVIIAKSDHTKRLSQTVVCLHLENENDRLFPHVTCECAYLTFCRTYIRGQNAPIDPDTLTEREKKRLANQEHLEALKKQVYHARVGFMHKIIHSIFAFIYELAQ